MFAKVASTGPASPKGDQDTDSPEEHGHHSGDDHGRDHGGKELKQHGKVDEYHVKLNPDSPFTEVKNLSDALYTEFFVIASGDNYKSPEVSNEVHVNARIIVLHSQNLKNMKVAYPMIFKATTICALKGTAVNSQRTMPILINDLTAQFRRLSLSSLGYNVTDSFIARGKYFKSGATFQEEAEAYDKWLRDPFVGAAVMNKLFFRGIPKNDKPPYKILRAMLNYVNINLHISKEAADQATKLRNIYTTTIAKTVQAVSPAHELHKATIVYYENLMELLSEDADPLLKLYEDREMAPGMMYDDKPF